MLKTKNGYALNEVVSALQKSIRRGKEEDALFWAIEMCPKYEEYLWKRLLIIAYEDISPLVPGDIPANVSRMREDYFSFRQAGTDAALLVISSAVLLMCRSRKSRIAEHLLFAVGMKIEDGYRAEVPDYALDMHTGRGKKMGRDLTHFAEIGALVDPEAEEIENPYKKIYDDMLKEGKCKIESFRWAKEKRKNGKNKKNNGEIEVEKELCNNDIDTPNPIELLERG
ncbi:MAG: hypothetical protein IBX72_11495 [Nitrospirae bacterium]|nr:hypothetical protein [Nitrospirota bacterium]